MDDSAPGQGADIRALRLLRGLVIVLTAVMIAGVLVLIALFVTRFSAAPATLDLPTSITLPEGVQARAFTQAETWYAVVTDAGEILIYDRETGALSQTVTISAPQP
ncbi:MAG: DUF6476 family protein [Pseudomonadota bacterium]